MYWKEVESGQPDEHWIYATGWITEMDGGQVVGTRFATYKYDATHEDPFFAPPVPTAKAFFPPMGGPGHVSIQSGDSYKAVDMVVDELTGDVYVVGEGPASPGGTNQDYIVVKYNKDLEPVWTPQASFYDGPVSGDDIPADIGMDVSVEVVVVTGSSPGNGTGLDIATVAFNTSDGSKVT